MTTEKTIGSTEVKTMTITEAKDMARLYREHDIPTFLHSAPGIGKSAIMKQLAEEDGTDENGKPNTGFIDIRIGTMLPEDLTGIPVPDLEKRLAVWLRATFWPEEQRDGKRGIIAFDELSDAPRNLQSCIYRVVLDRQIGEYKLPPGWWPVAAGNRREDRAAAQSLSTALANRFAHIHVRADSAAWIQWANVNDIDPMLIGFIKFRPDLIHSMEGANLLAFPTPRSWSVASKVFNTPADVRFRALCGIVGEGVATEVNAFFKVVDLPDFEDIVKRPKTANIPDEPASKYALSSLLSRKLDSLNFKPIYTYITRDEFGADLATVVVLDAAKRDPSLCDSPMFAVWAKNNTSLRI
jgi:hypothetical protein